MSELLDRMEAEPRRRCLHDFSIWAHEKQREPERSDWRRWLLLGGRGAGKSRAGAEWIKRRVRYADRPLRVALVGPSLPEARSVSLTTAARRARDIAAFLAEGAIDGLSIGFRTVRAERDRASGLRRLIQLDLWEISLVTFPMMANARIAATSLSSTTNPVRT
ncbi:MAG TPA: HK97 family phage prohead protease [Aestuariivirgaceae bacterium]